VIVVAYVHSYSVIPQFIGPSFPQTADLERQKNVVELSTNEKPAPKKRNFHLLMFSTGIAGEEVCYCCCCCCVVVVVVCCLFLFYV